MLKLLSIITGICIAMTSSYPFHASCQIKWDFSITSCDVVRSKLVQQIQKWKGRDNCEQGGEKCLYHLVSNTPSQVTATHTTPKKEYVDSLTMTFAPVQIFQDSKVVSFEKDFSSGCSVSAHSRSNVWYAILDYGTNYCNLRNLVVGSGLVNVTGFTETTNDHVCTEFTSADCNKY